MSICNSVLNYYSDNEQTDSAQADELLNDNSGHETHVIPLPRMVVGREKEDTGSGGLWPQRISQGGNVQGACGWGGWVRGSS